LNPELYIQYVNNIELCDKNIEDPELASHYLNIAIESIQDLALYAPQYDLEEDILDVARQLEEVIQTEALRTKKNFRPVY